MHPRRQVAARGGSRSWASRAPSGCDQHADGDAASRAGAAPGCTPTKTPPSRTSVRPCSWSAAPSATASQPRAASRGEVGAEAPDEFLVFGAGESGDPPAAVLGECHDVRPDRASGPGHQQAPASTVTEQIDQLVCGEAVERNRCAGGQVEAVRHDGGVARRDDQLLGVRAEVAVEAGDQPRDAAADRDVDVRDRPR